VENLHHGGQAGSAELFVDDDSRGFFHG